MALSITSLKKGTIFALDGVPYKVVDYSQKVMGRGGSIVNVRIKSLLDGKVLDKTFKGNEQVNSATVENRQSQYLYSDDKAHFMDVASYEQYELPLADVEEQLGYLKEGDAVTAQFYDDRIISVELPKKIALKVTYTENAVRGDTSSTITKDATLETGKTIKVPAFIKTGDIVVINTETGEYRERAK